MPLPYTGKKGELNFQEDLVALLKDVGWEPKTLNDITGHKYVTEQDIIDNWKNIIFENNKQSDRLNGVPLSDNEMQQILKKVDLECNTPIKANIFINRNEKENIQITRDVNSKDTKNAGQPVYLTLFSPEEIAGGKTRYQIAEQIEFKTGKHFNDRRGDIMLLINGMPLIHIELKASGVPVIEATNQIETYAKEKVFTGVFSLIQVFFAITPEDALYFANPGDYKKYNPAFFFRWGDKENNIIKDWRELCKGVNPILSIPEAHKLIGYYTVADKAKDTLMVARSYQYNAINAIVDKVRKKNWTNAKQLGGYIWCTTGGGKTMTSFKAGQMIIDMGLADKVVFVVDRTELNTQSLDEYNSFARVGQKVEETSNTSILFKKLKSKNEEDLIVTTIQKLSNINDDKAALKKNDLDEIKSKRIVFIIDEAHRSQFGEMHGKIKSTFQNALFIGFTGTPIMTENDKDNTTKTAFGDCLSIYSIANGIRDKNVLGFAPHSVHTYKDSDLRERVALEQCHATSFDEVKNNPSKMETYKKFINEVSMWTKKVFDVDGNPTIIKGIEDLLPKDQYDNDEHRMAVINNILENWDVLSNGQKGTKFHAILATDSIPEAIEYYHIFKKKNEDGECNLNVTSLFDPHIDNNSSRKKAHAKEDAIIEIIEDYNNQFFKTQKFDRKNDPNGKKFKTDVINRLAHKEGYKNISNHDDMIDIIIVVDQLLTGFDSKYVNTLYLDKELKMDNLIQAISRTNRVYDQEEKPFGIFRFYRKPYSMEKHLEEALKLYCEGGANMAKAATIEENMDTIKEIYTNIKDIFDREGIKDYGRCPKDALNRQEFKDNFSKLKILMNSIRLQGCKCDENGNYIRIDDAGNVHKLDFNKDTFDILQVRFEDCQVARNSGGSNTSKGSYNISTMTHEYEMEKITADYLEKHFKKVILDYKDESKNEEDKENAIQEFRNQLNKLSEIDQDYANRVIDDIINDILVYEEGKTLFDYITEYKDKDVMDKIVEESNLFGLDANLFKQIVDSKPKNERELNANNQFTQLKNGVNIDKVIETFKNRDGIILNRLNAKGKLDKELKDFIYGEENK